MDLLNRIYKKIVLFNQNTYENITDAPKILKKEKISNHKRIFNIILITSNRFHTLKENLKFIDHAFTNLNTRVTIFVDLPQRGFNTNLRNHVRNISLQKENIDFFIYEKHIGTRSLWLSILSMKPPFLVLEDDVFVSENVHKWYNYCVDTMNSNKKLFGCSFHSQPTVAVIGSKYKLNIKNQYTYPLVGSHGFMISPHHSSNFVDHLQTRNKKTLYIPNLITTKWYKEFEKRKITHERMWTQEAVAYTYHKNLTILYPPTNFPYAVHCSSGHASDTILKKCNKFFKNKYKLKDKKISNVDWNGKCISNC